MKRTIELIVGALLIVAWLLFLAIGIDVFLFPISGTFLSKYVMKIFHSDTLSFVAIFLSTLVLYYIPVIFVVKHVKKNLNISDKERSWYLSKSPWSRPFARITTPYYSMKYYYRYILKEH